MAGIRVFQIIVDQLLDLIEFVNGRVAVHEHFAAGLADAPVIHQKGEQRIAQVVVVGAVIARQGQNSRVTEIKDVVDSHFIGRSLFAEPDDIVGRVAVKPQTPQGKFIVKTDCNGSWQNLEALEKQNTYSLQTLRWIGYHGISVILLEQGRKCFIFRNGDRCIWFVITCHDVNAFVEQGHEIGRKQCLKLVTEGPAVLLIEGNPSSSMERMMIPRIKRFG